MLRNIDLNEISDGKLYTSNDMAKTDCGGCQGCSACCHGMGTSITLDPLDFHRLSSGLGRSFNELITGPIELNVVDGIILPNLKMTGKDEACAFLDQNGRCSVHLIRPGICRIFPLGRFYEDGSFRYFLQIHECPKPNRTKVRIRKWIDTPKCQKYEKYISDWHYYIKGLQEYAIENIRTDAVQKLSMQVLTTFYVQPFNPDHDFYEQFYERLQTASV